uniref:Fatty-acid O-methyltransferase n=1 Tax=Thermosporothrix sp. COM3 TaxID=2490863 RepID=A0A455SGT2_9CHLR|nr:fatty-acid O-methyltransferase [Thermosporothrix sp. COM3]
MKESVIAKKFDQMCDMSPLIRRFLIRSWYQFLSTLDRETQMPFMNLGYAPLESEEEVELLEQDEPHRYCIQMYRHVVSAVDLRDLNVLEIGSGRGGGAAYITRTYPLRALTGIDIASRAIRFCRAHYHVEGLSFFQGDAEALPLGDSTFDAVINIESSFSYGHFDRFLNEVFRVLRPGGFLLMADYREKERMKDLRERLSRSNFTVLRERLINPQVLRALELDTARRTALIQRNVPGFLQGVLHDFAATKGTRMYNALKSGVVEYRSWTLQKPARSAIPDAIYTVSSGSCEKGNTASY